MLILLAKLVVSRQHQQRLPEGIVRRRASVLVQAGVQAYQGQQDDMSDRSSLCFHRCTERG